MEKPRPWGEFEQLPRRPRGKAPWHTTYSHSCFLCSSKPAQCWCPRSETHSRKAAEREIPPSGSCETRQARTHRHHLFTDAAAPATVIKTARDSKGAAPKLFECVVSLHPELSHEHHAKFHLHQPVQPRHTFRGLLYYSSNVPRVGRVTY